MYRRRWTVLRAWICHRIGGQRQLVASCCVLANALLPHHPEKQHPVDRTDTIVLEALHDVIHISLTTLLACARRARALLTHHPGHQWPVDTANE